MNSPSRGMVFIHSAPRAYRPHIEWAVGRVVGRALGCRWAAQRILPDSCRTEFAWEAEAGCGARLASALQQWPGMRFEVTEDPSPGLDGQRWMFTPEQGMHRAQTDVSGNVVIPENRVRAALDASHGDPYALHTAVEELLGASWDLELDVFRCAGDDSTVVWMHRTG